MKHTFSASIAALLLVGCGQPDILEAVRTGNSKALEKHLNAGDTLSRTVVYGHLLLEVDIDQVFEENDASPIFDVAKILHKRTKPYGLSDSRIKAISWSSIVVDLSTLDRGIPNGYKQLVTNTAYLEFALVHKDSERLIANGIIPDGYRKYPQVRTDSDDKEIAEELLIQMDKDQPNKAWNQYGLKGEHIKNASPSRDPLTQTPMILFTLNSEGAKAMGQLSGNNIGERMAIILDGELMSAPVLQERITSNAQVTGDFTAEEAANIANALENPLKAPLTIKERYTDSKLSLGAALLRIAIIRNYTQIIELLIKQRPEVINAIGKNKETALDFAVRYNKVKIADLLRQNGGNANTVLK